MIRTALATIVLFFLTSYTLAEPFRFRTGQPTVETSEIAYQEAVKRLDEFMKKIEELRSHIDRSQFDLEALLDRIGYEAEDIIRFVKEEIAFEQYPGLLRGAQGTLMSRAGNALDQSVLLATLLKDAGYEARVLEGELSRNLAHQLLREMFTHTSNKADKEKKRETLAGVRQFLAQHNAEIEPPQTKIEDSPLFEETQKLSENLLSLTQESHKRLLSSRFEETLIEETTAYFWVEYRIGPSAAWKAIHPVADGDSFRNLKLAPRNVFADTVPEKLLHQVKVEIINEQKRADNLVEYELFTPWIAPAANLHAQIITITNIPDTLASLKTPENLEDALVKATIFAPVIGSSLPNGSQMFDLQGTKIDPLAAASPAAGVFSQVSRAIGSAAGAIDAGEQRKEDYVALSAQKLKISLLNPNGSAKVFERSLLDRVGAANRLSGSTGLSKDLSKREIVFRLTEFRSLMVNVGSVPQDFILDEISRRLLSSRILVEALLKKALRPEVPISLSREELQKVKNGWLGLFLLFKIFDASLHDNVAAVASYRAEPSLVMHRQAIAVSDQNVAIDIITNERRSLLRNPTGIVPAFHVSVERGIWETLTEGLLFDPDLEGPSTSSVFREAKRESIHSILISPDEAQVLDQLEISDDARFYARRDLDAGFHVLIPTRTPKSLARTGWWRIDLRNGTTLGMLDNGEGSQSVEQITLISAVAGGVAGGAVFVACVYFKRHFVHGDKGWVPLPEILRAFGDCIGLGITGGVVWGGIGMLAAATGTTLLIGVGAVLVGALGFMSSALTLAADALE